MRVHVTFVILLIWIAAESSVSGGYQAAAAGVGFVVLLFACVVAHEFGHILAAKRYGIRTPEIILLPIGGVSLMERLPERPAHELLVAVAGPAVSVAIGLVLFGLAGAPDTSALERLDFSQLLPVLAQTNLFLALFNMLPAFPMDGGRAVRALLAIRLGRLRATRAAAMLGHGFAIAFGLLGLAGGNLMLVLLAVFIYFGASAESADAELLDLADRLPVRRAMRAEPRSLPADASIDDGLDLVMVTGQDAVPVFEQAGQLAGVATMSAIVEAVRRGRGSAPIREVVENVPVVGQDHLLRDAIDLMRATQAPATIVMDRHGEPAGMITPQDLADMRGILRKTHRGGGRFKNRPASSLGSLSDEP